MDAQVAADFALLGMAVDVADVADLDDGFEVHPDNWESLMTFLACETQWRMTAGFGIVIWSGLDYAGADVVFRRRSVSDAVFADIQIMEREAIAAFAEVGNGK